MPCCQALGRVGAFQKLQDPIVFVNDLHGAVSVMESKFGFGATMRSVSCLVCVHAWAIPWRSALCHSLCHIFPLQLIWTSLQWACRPGAVALESESGTRPPARFMPFMPYKSRRLLETSGSAHSPLTQCFHKMNCLRLDATWQGNDHQDSDPLHFYVHSKAEILQLQLQMNLKDRHEIYIICIFNILSQNAIYIYLYAMSLCHA